MAANMGAGSSAPNWYGHPWKELVCSSVTWRQGPYWRIFQMGSSKPKRTTLTIIALSWNQGALFKKSVLQNARVIWETKKRSMEYSEYGSDWRVSKWVEQSSHIGFQTGQDNPVLHQFPETKCGIEVWCIPNILGWWITTVVEEG